MPGDPRPVRPGGGPGVLAPDRPSRTRFARLAAAGLALLFVLQAIINMAVNVGLVPAKGMTLPFISSGGSSMLAVGLAMGMLLAVTRRRPDPARVKKPGFVSRPGNLTRQSEAVQRS